MDLLPVPSTGPGTEQALNSQAGGQRTTRKLPGATVMRHAVMMVRPDVCPAQEGMGSGPKGRQGKGRKRNAFFKAQYCTRSGLRGHSRTVDYADWKRRWRALKCRLPSVVDPHFRQSKQRRQTFAIRGWEAHLTRAAVGQMLGCPKHTKRGFVRGWKSIICCKLKTRT